MDDKKQPSFTTLDIKQSKTDPFRKGVTVVITHAVGPLCPIVEIPSSMAMRRPGKGPLFHFEDGRLFTKELLLWQGYGKCCSRLALSNHSTIDI